MQFSGKITNSMIQYLQHLGEDLNPLHEMGELPFEFLRDPTAWLDARAVEHLLEAIDRFYGPSHPDKNLLERAGHAARELKAWGVLDSVLRMMQEPQDIFTQPQRFISYFISPAPPIGNLQKRETEIGFDLPMSHDEFPNVSAYLKSALEALPTLMGEEMAQVRWAGTRVTVTWSRDQERFFQGEKDGRNIRPEFMRSLVEALESKERELLQQKQELERIKRENAKAADSLMAIDHRSIEGPLKITRQQILKLRDYFVRSQQLVTLLVGQDRMNAQVKEAMKRVNWELVQKEFPKTVETTLEQLERTRSELRDRQSTLRSRPCPPPQLEMFTPAKL